MTVGGASNRVDTEAAPAINFQVGLAYVLPDRLGSQFRLGYQLEQWWNLGNVEVGTQGVFASFQLGF